MTEALRAGAGGRQDASRSCCARGSAARPGLPSRRWARTSSSGGWRMRDRAAQRARPPHRRRPLGADPREPDAGRQPGAADHRHHRGAAPRRASCGCSALAVEQAGDPVEITGADHGFTYVNHAFETTTGYSRAEALGRQPQEILVERRCIRRSSSPGCAASSRPARTWQGTIVNRHRDGHLIEQETTIAPLRDEGGRITHYVAVKRDVTEARAQARALAASEARYRAVVDAQTEFIVRVGPDGYWTFMNEAAERYIGLTLEEMRARGHARLGLDPARGPPALRRAHGADHPGEPDAARSSGAASIRTAACTGSTGPTPASSTPTGKLVEIQCIGREITDRKLAEAAREEAERLRLGGARGGARLLHRHRRPRPDRRVQRRRRAHLRLRPRRGDRPADGRADRAAAPARAAHAARPRAAARPAAARTCSAGGSRSTRCAPTARSSRSSSSSCRASAAAAPIFLAYMRDLSERRAAERALAEREAQFRTIAESVPVGLRDQRDRHRPAALHQPAVARGTSGSGRTRSPSTLLRRLGEARAARPRWSRELVEHGATRAVEVDLAMPSGRRMKALISATRIALRRARGDAGRHRRHHRAARDRGGARGEPERGSTPSWTSRRSPRTCATPRGAT